jgi:hypothetical protein
MNGVPDRLPKLPSALILATGGPSRHYEETQLATAKKSAIRTIPKGFVLSVGQSSSQNRNDVAQPQ